MNLTRRNFLTNILKSLAALPALAVVPKGDWQSLMPFADKVKLSSLPPAPLLRWPQTPISDELKDDAIIQLDDSLWQRLAIAQGDRILAQYREQAETKTGKAAYPITPGTLLIKREDGLLYPFNHAHPFAGVATTSADAGECVEYVEAR